MHGSVNIVVLITVFSVLAVIIFLTILITRLWYYRSDKEEKELRWKIRNILDEYLNKESGVEGAITSMRGIADSNFHCDVWIDELIILTDHFSGIYLERVFLLFEQSGLHKRSFYKLLNGRKDDKIRAMHELSMMEHKDAFDEIVKFMNSSNPEIRRNARVAMVKLRKKKGLLELRNIRGNMTDWTFINIISTLKRSPIKLRQDEMQLLKEAESKFIRLLSNELENTVYVS